MEFIRPVHPKHYSRNRKRFESVAFQNSSDGSGISVISSSCIKRKNKNICGHIEKYYSSPLTGDPIIFWKINSDTLPTSCRFVQSPSTTGDECHHNIENLSDNEARRMIIRQFPSNFRLCHGHRVTRFNERSLPLE